MSSGIILIKDEPLESVLTTWLSWMVVMIIFAMAVIYLSNYFARSTECLVANKYHIGHPVQDLKNEKWRSRFNQVDRKQFKALEGINYGKLIAPKNSVEGFTIPNPYSNNQQTVGDLYNRERVDDLSGYHYYLV